MTVLSQNKNFSLDEYFAIEAESLEKLEYYNGKIYPMPGGTTNHNEICANVIIAIGNAIKKLPKKYRLYTSDMKIQIEKENKFVYPDAVVICEEPEYYKDRKDIIVNPILIVEVLSPETEENDRNGKFDSYRHLPTFQEYVLVSQNRIEAATFLREAKDLWRTSDFENIKDTIPLKSIGIEILMEDIFDGIEF
jgi:Uma2 family endonuclease